MSSFARPLAVASLPFALLLAVPASAQVQTLPFTEDFEGEIQCPTGCGPTCNLLGVMTNDAGHQLNWTSDRGGTPTWVTGPSVDNTLGDNTGTYVYTESSCNGTGYPNRTSNLLSPVLDLSVAAASLSFAYHLYGVEQGVMSVDVQLPTTASADLDALAGTITAAAGDFDDVTVGGHVEITGSANGNDGLYEVVSVDSTTQITVLEALVDEFGATVSYFDADGAWTLDLWGPTTDDLDAWQTASVVAVLPQGADARFRIRNVTGTGYISDAAIDDISVVPAPHNNLAVTDIDTPIGGCADVGLSDVVATISNTGSLDQGPFDISYSLDGGPPVVETIALLLSGDSVVHTFATQVDISAAGDYDLVVTALLAADEDTSDDALIESGTVLAYLDATNYFEDFELGDGDWSAVNETNSNWALGTPAQGVISGAFSGDSAWATGLTGNYAANMLGHVLGPCLDFSAVTDPEVEIQVWYNSEFSWDGAHLQYTIDGGANWELIGALNDSLNWYTDNTITGLTPGSGWSGRNSTNNGSGGYLRASHSVPALAGLQARLRVQFGSDGLFQDQGFAFDDVAAFDAPVGVRVKDASPGLTLDVVLAGDLDVVVASYTMDAYLAAQSVDGLVFDLTGTAADADIASVWAWLDDGDGAFDSALDIPLGQDVFVGGAVAFDTTGLVALAEYDRAQIWLTYDIGPAALPGTTFGASLDVTLQTATPDGIYGPETVIDSELRAVFGAADFLPLDDFVDDAGFNRAAIGAAQLDFPAAATAGPVASVVTSINDAVVELVEVAEVDDGIGGFITVDPNSPPRMAAIHFPNGDAVGAMDWYFDFSGLDANADRVRMDLTWNNSNEEDDDADGVFVSVDGGSTWVAKAYDYDFTTLVAPGWTTTTIDLSQALLDTGSNFTSDVVVRVQAAGLSALGDDGLLIDDTLFGFFQDADVERVTGVPIADGGTDDLGSLEATLPNSYSWTVSNGGDFDLDLDLGSFVTANAVNVSSVVVTAPTDGDLAPAESDTTTVDFEVDAGGAFSFDLVFESDDPRLVAGEYTVQVAGVGFVEPDLLVQDSLAADINDGDTLTVTGTSTGVSNAATFTLLNLGTGALSLTGLAPDYVVLANLNNVTASVTTPPTASIAVGGSAAVALDLVPQADGPWSLDVLVLSDDPDTALYEFTIAGDATSSALAVARSGNPVANGGTDLAGDSRVGLTASWTYDLTNNGTADLDLDGLPDRVAVANASNVVATVAPGPSTPVAPAAATSFGVDYTPSAVGAFSFDLVIASNDPVNDPYVVTVSGDGVEPDIELTVAASALANGGSTDLGDLPVAVGSAVALTIENLGSDDLQLTAVDFVAIGATSNAAATVSSQPTSPVAPGGSEASSVTVTPAADGAFIVLLIVESDDPDENPYSVIVTGTGVSADVQLSRDSLGIADGGADSVGDVRPGTWTLDYSIDNNGTGSLALTDPSPHVAISGESNVAATITLAPAASVGAASSEPFTVEYTPAALGAFSFDVTVANDSLTAAGYTFTVSGVAVEPEIDVLRDAASIANGALDDAGDIRVGLATTWTYTIANIGTGDLGLTGDPDLVAVANASNAAVAVTVAPTTPVAGAGSTTFDVEYTAVAAGAFSFDLVVESDASTNAVYTVTVSGAGVEPDIDVTVDGVAQANGATVSMGDVPVGLSVGAAFVVTNLGTSDLSLTGLPDPVALSGETNVAGSVSLQPASPVAAGLSESFDVLLVVTADGAFAVDVTVDSDDPDEAPYVLSLTGTGVSPDFVVSRDATTIPNGGTDALGDQPLASAMLTFSIDNAGTGPLALTGLDLVAVSNESNATATVTTAPASTVAAASSETFEVEFTPTALGAFAFDLSIDTDSLSDPTWSWTVSGTAVEADIELSRDATVLASGDSDDLGEVATGELFAVTWTLTNVGTAPLNLTGADTVAIAALTNATAAVSESADALLGVGVGDDFTVDITPEADGAFSFDLVIESDDLDEGTTTVTVTGTAVSPQVEVLRDDAVIAHEGSDDLGALAVGEATTVTWEVRNPGTAELTLAEPPVTFSGETNTTVTMAAAPALSIAAGGSTTFDLEVTVDAEGEAQFDLALDTNAGAFTWTVLARGEAAGDDDDSVSDDDDSFTGDDDDSTDGCDCTSSVTGRGDVPGLLAGLLLGLAALRRRRA